MRKFLDQYDLYDSHGNLLVSKGMPEHIKVWFDNYKLSHNLEYPYKVVSLSTIYELEVNEDTPLGAWREFAYKCKGGI